MTFEEALDAAPTRFVPVFHTALLDWYARDQRRMPWRETDDPYRIWVSEVMLQQTRVDQASPYYQQFLAAFPTVEALAEASLDDVLLRWEGLGYYSRARHLHRAAQQIVSEHGGRLPDRYAALRRLPGIGPYTAAAVLSIAYGRPHAVLDGNVMRVLTRVFSLKDDITRSQTRGRLQTLADRLLPPEQPGTYNQAVMELGATVCTPRSPDCPRCPLRTVCSARTEQAPEAYPVKTKKAPVPHYDIAVGLIFNAAEELLIQRRREDQMLGGLWEFPGGKRREGEPLEATCRREVREELGVDVDVLEPFGRVSHAYSHFKITLHAFRCRILAGDPTAREGQPLRWVSLEALDQFAFPRANRRLLDALIARRSRPTLFD